MRKLKYRTANEGAATQRSYLQSRPQRERLFCAALSVALEQGFGHVTMNAVAKKAGVSKGGLLYHFGCKSDLIRALLVRCAEPHAGLCATLGITNLAENVEPLAIAALIAAADDPSLLEPMVERLGLRDLLRDRLGNRGSLSLAVRLAGKLRIDVL